MLVILLFKLKFIVYSPSNVTISIIGHFIIHNWLSQWIMDVSFYYFCPFHITQRFVRKRSNGIADYFGSFGHWSISKKSHHQLYQRKSLNMHKRPICTVVYRKLQQIAAVLFKKYKAWKGFEIIFALPKNKTNNFPKYFWTMILQRKVTLLCYSYKYY